MLRVFFIILLLCCSALASFAQSTVESRVTGNDSLPLPGVSVKNIRSGMLAVSGADGRFRINAFPADTLLFTAIGYIPIAIRAGSLSAVLRMRTQITQLAGIEVRKRTHTADSVALREEYRRHFDFRRPKWYEVGMITPVGIGVNIDKLYKALSFANNKRSDIFKKRLLSHEQERFIDQRFTPELVGRFTGLQGDSLIRFINTHRPDFKFTREAADYDFLLFIREECLRFRKGL